MQPEYSHTVSAGGGEVTPDQQTVHLGADHGASTHGFVGRLHQDQSLKKTLSTMPVFGDVDVVLGTVAVTVGVHGAVVCQWCWYQKVDLWRTSLLSEYRG